MGQKLSSFRYGSTVNHSFKGAILEFLEFRVNEAVSPKYSSSLLGDQGYTDQLIQDNSQLSHFHRGSSFLVSCTPLDQILTTQGHLSKVSRGTYYSQIHSQKIGISCALVY